MSILLIIPKQNINEKEDYSYIFSLGLAYISSVLKVNGYAVDCLNLNHHKGSIGGLIKNKLDSKKYDFVCTGMISTNYNCAKLIIDVVKKHNSRPKVILGGLIITSEPKMVFKLLDPDYAVIGEGEETILELLNILKEKGNLSNVSGICFRDEQGKLISTPKRRGIEDLDKIPYPDFDELEFEKYLKNQHPNMHDYLYSAFDYPRAYPIMGSRGCPFNCTFCYHYDRYRKRSINNIMEELKKNVVKYKINSIIFYDECISLDKERLIELCSKMKKFRGNLGWELKWYLQLTVHNITDEILEIMKNSGVGGISYGFESFSPIVLKSMGKPITPELIDSAFKKTINAGLTVQANFIFGDVAETKETAGETLRWWTKNARGQIHLLFIQPYPGSKIYHYCLEKGIIKNKEEFIKNPVPLQDLNMTEGMTDKEFNDLRKATLRLTRNYRKHVVPKIMKKIGRNIYELCVECPHCKKDITYSNCLIENKWTYGFNVPCRECGLLFYTVGYFKKIGFQFYPITRKVIDNYRRYQRKLEELRLKLKQK